MITEIKLEGATGNEENPLLDLAAMLEEIAAELKEASGEHDPESLSPRLVHFSLAEGLRGPSILATTDDGEATAITTVHPQFEKGEL